MQFLRRRLEQLWQYGLGKPYAASEDSAALHIRVALSSFCSGGPANQDATVLSRASIFSQTSLNSLTVRLYSKPPRCFLFVHSVFHLFVSLVVVVVVVVVVVLLLLFCVCCFFSE